MRFIFLIFVSFAMFAQEAPKDTNYKAATAFRSSWMLYKNAPDNYSSSRAFAKEAEKLESSELKAAAYAYAILGAYLQNHVLYGEKLHKSLNEVGQEIGNIKWVDFCAVEQFGDQCAVCKGETKKNRVCKKCNGTKTCRNKDCKKGQIEVLEKLGEKFEKVEKDCPVCEATGFCQSCEGSGIYKIDCNICRSFGYLLNKTRIYAAFNKELPSMDALIKQHIVDAFGRDQEAQGKIKRGERYYTAEEINLMDERERLKQERTQREQQMQRERTLRAEMRAAKEKKYKALNTDVITKPEKALKVIDSDFAKELEPKKAQQIKIYRSQAEFIAEANQAEKAGDELKAISLLKKAQKIREHEIITERIKKLRLGSLGL